METTLKVKTASGSSCPDSIVSISFPSYTAPYYTAPQGGKNFIVGPSCQGSTDFFVIKTFLSNLSLVVVRMKRLEVEYYTTPDATGNPIAFQSVNFPDFVGTDIPNGFPSDIIDFGETIGAKLCQAPWSPEKLLSLKIIVKGLTTTGESIEAYSAINMGRD